MADAGGFVTMKRGSGIPRGNKAPPAESRVTRGRAVRMRLPVPLRILRTALLVVLTLVCAAGVARAQRLSALSPAPNWERLEKFQETMTRGEFVRLLDAIYAPGGAAAGIIEVRERDAVILKTLTPPEKFVLRFAKTAASAKPLRKTWRTVAELPAAPKKAPLTGVRIALDPGHIGGDWALMEGRSFQLPGDKPLREGEITLLVAKLAAPKLRALGAEVSFVRSATVPASRFTVDALRPAARKELALLGVADARENYDGERDPRKTDTVQWQAERLFYRVAEIHERARKVAALKPDLAVCIHFNAEDWRVADAPVFTPSNHLHVMVNGCYSAGELRFDDQRFEMLLRLLGRTHEGELPAAAPVAESLAKATGLPAFSYLGGNAVRATANEFVWARNLLANRIYGCPVVYLEPWCMNNAETYARIQAGDYDGEREVAGRMRRSIFREYADAIVEGLRAHFSTRRVAAPKRQAGKVPK